MGAGGLERPRGTGIGTESDRDPETQREADRQWGDGWGTEAQGERTATQADEEQLGKSWRLCLRKGKMGDGRQRPTGDTETGQERGSVEMEDVGGRGEQ